MQPRPSANRTTQPVSPPVERVQPVEPVEAEPVQTPVTSSESPTPVVPSSPNPRPWPRWLAVTALCLFVFFFALWQSSGQLHTSPFHPDESRWVNRATYLDELRHPLSSFWQDRYLTRAQPPMGSYLIGLGLLLQGKDLHTNGPWDFQYGFETAITWNVSHGNMPTYDNLIAARQWNMVLGALTCVMLVLIVGLLVNWVGGVIAGLFMAIHPLHLYLSTLAVSDAMFTTMFAFAVLSAIWLAKKPTWGRSILLAVALGMGAATKLSPLLIALGWTAYAIILFLDPWLQHAQYRTVIPKWRIWISSLVVLCLILAFALNRYAQREAAIAALCIGISLPILAILTKNWRFVSRKERGTERQLGWKLLVQMGLVGSFFVLVYPFLWPDPIGRTKIIFDFRKYEMDNQAGFWPQAAIHGPVDAMRRTWENLQDRTSSSDRIITWIGDQLGYNWSGHSIDLFLAIPGLLVLVYLAWKNGLASPHMLGMLAIAAQSVLILGALGVDFNRYYEPLVFTTAAGVGVLTGWLTSLVWSYARNYSRQPTQRSAANPGHPSSSSQPA